MGILSLAQMSSKVLLVNCKSCNVNLTTSENCESHFIQGEFGSAYLFSSVVNVISGERELRKFAKGYFWIRSITCKKCAITIGWFYEFAYEADQRYKEGKYVLERRCIKICDDNVGELPDEDLDVVEVEYI